MSITMQEHTGRTALAEWRRVCAIDDLELSWGEVALLRARQIAVFRIGADEVYAVDHRDPHTAAPVMARGIVGSRGERPTIASPLHKQVYDLETGECLSADGPGLRVFPVRVDDGVVQVVVVP
jgi:nitrite reductase (NADH) small subunit